VVVQVQRVTFKNGDIDIAGHIRFPDGFDEKKSYPALVIVTPGSSVKEQVGAVYGEKMADRGFITLAFDPSYQGSPQGLCAKLRKPAQTKNMGPAATRVGDARVLSWSRGAKQTGYCQACVAPCSPLLGTRWMSRRRPIAAA
jgi:fermentation-respiration switch protein FrsA (DUF1100 family)